MTKREQALEVMNKMEDGDHIKRFRKKKETE